MIQPIDSRRIRDAIQKSALGDLSERWIFSSMLSKAVYLSAERRFLVFLDDRDHDNVLVTLFTTSEKLRSPLSADDENLLSSLVGKISAPGFIRRFLSNIRNKRARLRHLKEMRNQLGSDNPMVKALEKFSVPTMHGGDFVVVFPEDDFTNEGRHDERQFQESLVSSGLSRIAKEIHGARSAPPSKISNKILAII